MKTLKSKVFLPVLVAGWLGAQAQTTLDAEVPGDNFSLEGALELFKKSQSPKQFEEMLNSADSRVNNLDLNHDGNIDYIRVIDRNDGNVHAFILQAVVSNSESQDIAVIELEKRGNGEAVLQITGDADIYGIETIIEPTEEVRVNAGTSTARTVVNVWTWPSVQYVYGPSYSVWVSPWGWAYHPVWWRPWRPVAYYVYDPWWRPYRPYYSVCHSHRIGYLPRLYRPYRRTSVIVHNHYYRDIDRYRSRNNGRDRDDSRYERRSDGDRYGDSRNSRTRSEASDYSRRNQDTRGRSATDNTSSFNRTRSVESGRTYDSYRRTESRSEGTTERTPTLSQRNIDRSRSQWNRTPEQRNETTRQRTINDGSFNRSRSNEPVKMNNPARNPQRMSSPPRSFERSPTRSSGSTGREIRSGSGNISRDASGGSRGRQRGRD